MPLWEVHGMYYGNIKYCDIADGEGVRTTLFVSGCTNHCKNCFQPQTWSFDYGKPFTEETESEILDSMKPPYIDGLTLLGGEPFEPENQRALVPFLRKVHSQFPDKNIWGYTGFVYDRDLVPGGRKYTEVTDEYLSYLKVLVDGPFVDELKDISLQFRGSSNQRIIDVQETRRQGKVVLYTPMQF
jgi:anaerobic ribonucleoside-triphosphate reductase activating protein